MAATILNTDANINAKTVMAAENAETVTGLKTFDRDPNAPFAVSAGSAVVPNLDADKLDGLEATDLIKKDGTVSMTAKLNLGSSGITYGQIQFPASQNSSADVNTLDDYEEGTWVPVVASAGGGAPTYTTQGGYYTKEGDTINFWGRVTLATIGTLAAGAVTITGLPLASLNQSSYFGGCVFTYWASMTTNIVTLMGTVAPNTQVITIRHAAAAAAGLSTTLVADISGTLDIIFFGSYKTAS